MKDGNFTADRLLALYDRVAEAEDAIPRLRRFVLDLAVRGKLVEQDPNDNPATELLKRLRFERSKGVKEGQFRPSKSLPVSKAGTQLYEIPSSWIWCFADDLWDFENGDRSSNYPSRDQLVVSGIPFINAGHLVDGKVSLADMNYITLEKYDSLGGGKLRKGDQLYCLRGSLGKHAIFDHQTNAAIASSLVIMRSIIEPCVSYLRVYLDSGVATIFLKRFDNGSAQPNLSSANLRKYEVPLPPLAEQHRIVAKVDELMALCDQLEQARAGREAVRDRLTTASLARLTAPETDAETFQSHARFALQTLPTLTTRPDHIKTLRQTILNLAVRGKLVEQDTTDEPAKISANLIEPSHPSLPKTWCFVRLVHLLSEGTRNGYSRKPDDAENGVPILRISAGTVRQDGVIAEEEHKLISGIDGPTREQYGLKVGDLLACRFNGNKFFVGRLKIFEDYLGLQPIYPDKLIRVRLSSGLALPKYVRIAGESDFVRSAIEDACATTVGNWGISASNLKEVPIPLPPLAEQHRIVAKVDALMALCDQLEAALTTTATTRSNLLNALLHEVLEPAAELVSEAAE